MTARDRGSHVVFDPAEVDRYRASDKYVVFQRGGKEMLLERSLNELKEARLGVGPRYMERRSLPVPMKPGCEAPFA